MESKVNNWGPQLPNRKNSHVHNNNDQNLNKPLVYCHFQPQHDPIYMSNLRPTTHNTLIFIKSLLLHWFLLESMLVFAKCIVQCKKISILI